MYSVVGNAVYLETSIDYQRVLIIDFYDVDSPCIIKDSKEPSDPNIVHSCTFLPPTVPLKS